MGFLEKSRGLKNIGLIQERIIVEVKEILSGSSRNGLCVSLRIVDWVDQDAYIQLADFVLERESLVFGRTLVVFLVVFLSLRSVVLIEKSEDIIAIG